MTREEAAAYLRPIMENATLHRYQEALRLAVEALEGRADDPTRRDDGLDPDRLRELARAEKDGRLVVLPCKKDTVYTVEEDYFNCDRCKHGSMAYYQPKIGRVSCDMDKEFHCPFYVKAHEVSGFEIMFDKTGAPVLSLPGEFGYEGLEQFCGIDGKIYYTREEAEAALKNMEAEDNEAVR